MKKIIILCFFAQYFLILSQNVTFSRESIDDEVFIFANNPEFTDVSIEFEYNSENWDSSLKKKEIVVVPPQSERTIITKLKKIDSKKPTKFSYTAYFVWGDIHNQKYNDSYIYLLPFENGKMYKVFQGYNGKFSHQNAFSLDFSLLEGDKVLAAREGKVVEVIDQFHQSCEKRECSEYNNKIIIQHSDESFAEYVHLKKGGSIVKVGQIVDRGQHIGYSGSTGWTKGPHLHFSVFYNKINGERTYHKTYFNTSNSRNPQLLETGKYYSVN